MAKHPAFNRKIPISSIGVPTILKVRYGCAGTGIQTVENLDQNGLAQICHLGE